jgi:hypothetical protein
MCRLDASRDSADVWNGMSRVAVWGVLGVADSGERVARWTSVGRWACAGDIEGLGWVSTTMLRGLRASSGWPFGASFSSGSSWVNS